MSEPRVDPRELACWLALNRAPGLGPARIKALLDAHGSARRCLACTDTELAAAGVPDPARTYLRSEPWPGVEQDLAWLRTSDHHLLTLQDPAYPPRLAQLSDAPAVLFVAGDLEALTRPQLAMVGSRNPTPSGCDTAYGFAAELAGTGITITSGLASGVDAASHRGAIAADGFTIAVLGCGPEQVYPRRHCELSLEVVEHGAMVTEFAVGTAPAASNFPRRNRIISGLSVGVLVVEAAVRSGSLISARLAAEQGREVLAIPGSIHNPLARGCHQLIRQGAKLVETVDDVLEEIGPLLGEELSTACTGPSASPAITHHEGTGLEPEYRALLELVGYDPTSVDVLSDRSGLTAQEVSSMLLQLELGGFIASLTGGLYTRNPRKR